MIQHEGFAGGCLFYANGLFLLAIMLIINQVATNVRNPLSLSFIGFYKLLCYIYLKFKLKQLNMKPELINWLAVIVAALSAFMVGGIWYARPLFGMAWMKESKLTEEEVKTGNKGKIFGMTLVFSLIMSANLAAFLATETTTTAWGAQAGFLAGVWTFGAIAIHSLFELKSWKYIFINGGYSVVSLVIMGAILGAWR